MKTGTVLWIAGAAIAAGTAVYATCQLLRAQPATAKPVHTPRCTPQINGCNQNEKHNPAAETIVAAPSAPADLQEAKATTAAAIQERHHTAAAATEDSLCSMKADFAETKRRLDQISRDLEALLK